MIEEEEKTTHDVVAGTLLVYSNLACILFDSGANYYFVSHGFCNKLIRPLATLSQSYCIDMHVSVNHM